MNVIVFALDRASMVSDLKCLSFFDITLRFFCGRLRSSEKRNFRTFHIWSPKLEISTLKIFQKKNFFQSQKFDCVLWLGHSIRTFPWYKIQVLKSLKAINNHFTTHLRTIAVIYILVKPIYGRNFYPQIFIFFCFQSQKLNSVLWLGHWISTFPRWKFKHWNV